jgi:hypothetical protein
LKDHLALLNFQISEMPSFPALKVASKRQESYSSLRQGISEIQRA